MMAHLINTSSKILGAVAFSAVFAMQANAGEAARVLLKTGDAVVVHADRTETPANKGTILAEGDILETRKGRVQIETVDGAKITFLSQTVFKFNHYAYNGSEDGSGIAHTELIKGGLRTTAGQVGNKQADRYQMKTPAGNIHAAGGEFSVRYQDKLDLTANRGKVNVCNNGGCRQVLAGQTVQTSSSQSVASYSEQALKLTVAPATNSTWTNDSVTKKANLASLD